MPSVAKADIFSSPYLTYSLLRRTAAWIRDDLEILVAREGPKALNPDDVVTLVEMLQLLQVETIPPAMIASSRMHCAVREIAGKATRWPAKLINEADAVILHLEDRMGPLKNVKTPLYEKGGSLHGISLPQDINPELLMARFAEKGRWYIEDDRAYIRGGLGIPVGTWWINGLFAFRDGIIDKKSINGGIVWNEHGAYAIVISGADEANSPHPSHFTYRCGLEEKGRFRLTKPDFRSRMPIRILREHKSNSLWAPRAGIRYDGLYRIVGWGLVPVKPDENDGHICRYEVHFASEGSSATVNQDMSWDKLMGLPTAAQFDDYKMYRIIQREQREKQRQKEERERAKKREQVVHEIHITHTFATPAQSRPMSLHLPERDKSHYGDASSTISDATHTSSANTDHDPTTAVDGSSEHATPSSQHRRSAYRELFTPLNETETAISEYFPPPLGFTAIEPFSSLRHNANKPRERDYDGSADSKPDDSFMIARPFSPRPGGVIPNMDSRMSLRISTTGAIHHEPKFPPPPPPPPPPPGAVDTRFRPINWNPGPRARSSSFNLPDKTLDAIAPFRDRRRGTSSDVGISPRASVSNLHLQVPKPRRGSRPSSSDAISPKASWSNLRIRTRRAVRSSSELGIPEHGPRVSFVDGAGREGRRGASRG